jgi:glycosyltransferase involved in cell wall biosynthesis
MATVSNGLGGWPVTATDVSPPPEPGARFAAAIPIYNEREAIPDVVNAVREYVNEVVVIDDGSTDGSADAAAAAGAHVVIHDHNRGKGMGLQTALAWAKQHPEITDLVLIDGDGQHDPADIPRLLVEMKRRDLDILVGSRFLGNHNAPLYRLFGLHVLTASAGLGSGVYVTDSQSGYRVLSRRAIERLELAEAAFAVESEMQFEAAEKGLRLGETPIEIRYTGPARRSPVAHGVSVLISTILMTARRRPGRLPLLIATPFLAVRVGSRARPARTHGA